MATDKGYLVVKMVRTGKEPMIALPPPININAADANDQEIIHEEAIRASTKHKEKWISP
jgi:hypothetical protein